MFSSQTRFETPIEEMKKEDLNDCLKVFYAAVKQKDGKDFKVSSLRTIRAAIERYLKQPPINKPWSIVGVASPQFVRHAFISPPRTSADIYVLVCLNKPISG